MLDLKNLGLPEHTFRYFRVSFHDLLLKNQVAAVSHSAVTLQMISNNRRLASVINDHLLVEEARREFGSDHRILKTMAAFIHQVVLQSISSCGE
jgi:hypothetical protein